MAKQNQTPATINQDERTPSERFTDMVIQEFTGHSGSPDLGSYQKRLIQNYFISIDLALKLAEEKRMKKKEQFRDKLKITWQNINMQTLAVNVVACSRIGYDPALPNHINMMPFKNNTTNQYDIVFIPGYRGKELMAMKYGFQVPDDVIVEVVYENDTFKPIKKDRNNEVETYIFEIAEDAFNRGKIIGGFYYHAYKETSEKNRLMFYSLHEIEKRKPAYAAAEFWGGEKDKWENGQKVGRQKVEGWYHEMIWKTIYRAAYGSITIDGKKMDDDLMQMLQQERLHEFDNSEELRDIKVSSDKNRTIEKKGSKKNLNIEEAKVVPDPPDPEVERKDADPIADQRVDSTDKAAEDQAYEEAMAEANAEGDQQSAMPGF